MQTITRIPAAIPLDGGAKSSEAFSTLGSSNQNACTQAQLASLAAENYSPPIGDTKLGPLLPPPTIPLKNAHGAAALLKENQLIDAALLEMMQSNGPLLKEILDTAKSLEDQLIDPKFLQSLTAWLQAEHQPLVEYLSHFGMTDAPQLLKQVDVLVRDRRSVLEAAAQDNLSPMLALQDGHTELLLRWLAALFSMMTAERRNQVMMSQVAQGQSNLQVSAIQAGGFSQLSGSIAALAVGVALTAVTISLQARANKQQSASIKTNQRDQQVMDQRAMEVKAKQSGLGEQLKANTSQEKQRLKEQQQVAKEQQLNQQEIDLLEAQQNRGQGLFSNADKAKLQNLRDKNRELELQQQKLEGEKDKLQVEREQLLSDRRVLNQEEERYVKDGHAAEIRHKQITLSTEQSKALANALQALTPSLVMLVNQFANLVKTESESTQVMAGMGKDVGTSGKAAAEQAANKLLSELKQALDTLMSIIRGHDEVFSRIFNK